MNFPSILVIRYENIGAFTKMTHIAKGRIVELKSGVAVRTYEPLKRIYNVNNKSVRTPGNVA
jgi:hypothetical protein